MIYEVEEDGELIELKNPPQELPDNAAIIFISRETKRIYIWLGPKAGIKKKFIVAREGSKKRLEFSYPIVHVQNDGKEEEFSRDYLAYLNSGNVSGIPASKTTKSKPKPKPQSQPEPQPELKTESKPEPDFDDLNIPVETEDTQVKVVKESTSKVPKPNLPINTDVTISSDITLDNIENIVETMKELPVIDGHVRDYLIINGKVGVLDENTNPPTYKILEDVPSGIFEVQDLKPRVLIKDGEVLAIELWRKY